MQGVYIYVQLHEGCIHTFNVYVASYTVYFHYCRLHFVVSFDDSNYVDASLSCLKYQLLGGKVILPCFNSIAWKSMKVDFQFQKMLSILN